MPRIVRRWSAAFALCVVFAGLGAAKDAIFFTNGFTLEADSYTQTGTTVVLQIAGGTLQFEASQVARIERLPDAASRGTAATLEGELPPPEVMLGEAAYRQGVDQDFVRSVATIESGLRQTALSKKGAIGLMQLMPGTAARLQVDPSRAGDNAQGGAMYLRDLLIRYHGDSALALAAYNAGPGAVAKYRGVPPFPETRRYVNLVLREYSRRVAARKLAEAAKASIKSPPPQAGASRIASTHGSE